MKKAVYIPLIEGEIASLEFLLLCWEKYPPILNAETEQIDLYISFDQFTSYTLEPSKTRRLHRLGFRHIEVINANLSKEDAVYIRSPSNKESLPRYGAKSGPNLHFLYNQKNLLKLGYEYVFQCETDVIPTHSGWLSFIFNSTDRNALISGPMYMGPSRLGGRILRHINGNAVYNHKHHKFSELIHLIEHSILHLIEKEGFIASAFDTALFEVISMIEKTDKIQYYTIFKNFGLDSEMSLRRLIMLFSHNSSIVNFTGHSESQAHYPINCQHIIEEYEPAAKAIHSPMLRYWALGELLATETIANDHYDFLKDYSKRYLFNNFDYTKYNKYVKSDKNLLHKLTNSNLSPLIWRR